MDIEFGKNIVWYRKDDVRTALMKDPSLINNKKFMEAFAGFLVALALEEEQGRVLMVGFPLKKITKTAKPIPGPTLSEVIANPEIVEDCDVDVCVGDEAYMYFCQVTRLVARNESRDISNDFFSLLDKKSLIQPDKSLILIINVEDDISLNVDRLYEFFRKKKLPYGRIFIMGKSDRGYGNFRCHEIYPVIREGVEFNIKMPL